VVGVIVLAVTLAVGVVIGLFLRHRDGRMRTVSAPASDQAPQERSPGEPSAGATVLTSEDIGAELGERATLVQFSTAFCQPCRATRVVLGEVARIVPGVRHVEIDAESRLDLVRRLGIMRTPTVLVLDRSGNVVKRASGRPRKVDVIAALGAVVDDDAPRPAAETSHEPSQHSDKV
jgi:thiol-disulfide isomerase/thioredoxin